MKRCKECKEWFRPTWGRGPKKFCSKECAAEADRARHRMAWLGTERVTCAHCECEYLRSKGNPGNRPLCVRCRGIASHRSVNAKYSSRHDAVVRLWQQGLTTKQIAASLELSLPSVRVLISRLRGKGRNLPYRPAIRTVCERCGFVPPGYNVDIYLRNGLCTSCAEYVCLDCGTQLKTWCKTHMCAACNGAVEPGFRTDRSRSMVTAGLSNVRPQHWDRAIVAIESLPKRRGR